MIEFQWLLNGEVMLKVFFVARFSYVACMSCSACAVLMLVLVSCLRASNGYA